MDLVRVLGDEVSVQLSYWMVARSETLRRPEVAAVVAALRATVAQKRDMLMGM
jgi:hypothetical protein